nr:HAMP domain-containing histidine kinase [Thermoleophilaceae bacterium]
DVPEGPSDEITRLGATLNDMLDAQARSAERQQQFIDDASHELRTPLSTLSAEIDVALRKPRTSEEHEATLRRLAADTSRLVGLTENLLALGPLGSTVPDVKAVGGADVIAAAARRARGQLNGDGARKVEVRAPDDLVVHADRALLERALSNLVDNAVRYGDGAITLAVAPLEGLGEPAAILSVHDQGAGIDAGFLTHAAERFRQAESSRAGPGAGLGLSLVDAILAAHRGQLRICSAGRHHQQPTSDPALARVPCAHPADGTTISLLLGPDDDQV